ncbi:MAG: sulfite exporter TauE/SafE family protein [Planctomycetia bacterium]|nr:sulfite exporter TauE/SafE family protein [Planctomycetia bacterium]
MSVLLISAVALLASGLTFFSGFGLGTLLLPAFALFVPVEQAVALTAVVHFLNSIYKVVLVGRFIDTKTVLRFGLPAILAAIAGAWVLGLLTAIDPLLEYDALGRHFVVTPVKLAIGLLLIAFALLELIPATSSLSFAPRWLPVGGLLSGFFGGLSGMQGALRSAFLIRAGLSKEAFVATAAAIACLVDLSRMSIYATRLSAVADSLNLPLLLAAIIAALTGATLGRLFLHKVKFVAVQQIVAVMMLVIAGCLVSGLR